ncbi:MULTISPECIES: family 16 glycosylhydrolase [unclassified Tenacibaculum]|uniref:family 16 glycosylhydrolase n=1 Tax=unclassified Tenacibaculum TaxID=2635139 RepID=UPI001F43789B|nr:MULTISPECIES: family 16 glycosylhydrolase [unclassified Tenacibaculum]MCF2873822.1 family 16 glycosylhydrolase [Tenacibaculum sp. Cn5-1]MCF2933978.1 family 16 glycosylhydrolase [Tenacibaculum sp. Cn5-34]MCG7509440.1 family 16 glycosylhydrolase [Tenacibaculum sp. Cn5-46]
MNIITNNRKLLLLKYKLSKLITFFSKQEKLKSFSDNHKSINKVYVINLERQKKRWALIQKELGNIKTKNKESLLSYTEKISAIDARNKLNSTNKINPTYKLKDQYFVDPNPQLLDIIRKKEINIDLTKQEIAVALSHISVWEKIVSENIENSLILEDDIHFENKFSNKLNSLWEEISESKIEFDLIYLSYKKVDFSPDIKEFSNNLSIPNRGIWWFSGYILSKKGAQKLLNSLPITGPVDLWINHKFNKLKVYISNKSIINQKLFFVSDNSYSILPILSQIGIKSNKTFINLDKLKGVNPVFIFDLTTNNQTTLTKLDKLLSLNSYRTLNMKSGIESNHVVDLILKQDPLLFDAYIGFDSIIELIPNLVRFYPNVIIILLTDEDFLVPKTYSLYVNQKIYCFNPNKKNIIKKVSLLLKIKSWNLDDFKMPEITIDVNSKKVETNILNNHKYLEHDVTPWILPIENIKKYLPYNINENEISPIAKHIKNKTDYFEKLDLDFWTILEDTFPSNQAQFSKENFKLLNNENSGFQLEINNKKNGAKKYSSSSIFSKKQFLYGSFEISMKPIKGEGIISAFFLHRNDPWQEIDIEFLGNDTTKILLNVYYNPGIIGTNYNYGVRGTPVLIDLGFDASEDFHNYRVEWEFHEIRWYVDDKIIHVRKRWTPTPIPNLPMSLYVNAWITNSEELAGKFDEKTLPKASNIKHVKIYNFNYMKN